MPPSLKGKRAKSRQPISERVGMNLGTLSPPPQAPQLFLNCPGFYPCEYTDNLRVEDLIDYFIPPVLDFLALLSETSDDNSRYIRSQGGHPTQLIATLKRYQKTRADFVGRPRPIFLYLKDMLGLTSQSARSSVSELHINPKWGPKLFKVLKLACSEVEMRVTDERSIPATPQEKALLFARTTIQSVSRANWQTSPFFSYWERSRIVVLAHEYLQVHRGGPFRPS